MPGVTKGDALAWAHKTGRGPRRDWVLRVSIPRDLGNFGNRQNHTHDVVCDRD